MGEIGDVVAQEIEARTSGFDIGEKDRTVFPSRLLLSDPIQPRTEVTRYPLDGANEALADLREGRLQGAAVLIP